MLIVVRTASFKFYLYLLSYNIQVGTSGQVDLIWVLYFLIKVYLFNNKFCILLRMPVVVPSGVFKKKKKKRTEIEILIMKNIQLQLLAVLCGNQFTLTVQHCVLSTFYHLRLLLIFSYIKWSRWTLKFHALLQMA